MVSAGTPCMLSGHNERMRHSRVAGLSPLPGRSAHSVVPEQLQIWLFDINTISRQHPCAAVAAVMYCHAADMSAN